jgi:hypothetical protein
MINKKLSFLQARKFKKWLNLKENIKTICILADEKLCGNKQKLLIFESLTDTLNFRTTVKASVRDCHLGFAYTTGTSNISRLSFIFISFNLA